MNSVPNDVWYYLGFDPTDSSDWVSMSLIPEEIIIKVINEIRQ